MWLLTALAGTMGYVFVTFIDKYISEVEIENPLVFGTLSGLVSLFLGIILYAVFGLPGLNLESILLLLVAGILMGIATYLYFFAVAKADISNITILFQIIPIMVWVFGFAFLVETINLIQFGGLILIVLSVSAIVFSDRSKNPIDRKAILLILAYDVLYALVGVLIRSQATSAKFTHIVITEALGYASVTMFVIVCSSKVRRALLNLHKTIGLRPLLIIIGNEGILFTFAKGTMNFAYTLAPAALVSTVESTQAVMAIFVGYVLSVLIPNIFKEETNLKSLSKKLVYATFTLVGLYVIHL